MSSYLVYYENCANNRITKKTILIKSLNFFKENKENNDLY